MFESFIRLSYRLLAGPHRVNHNHFGWSCRTHLRSGAVRCVHASSASSSFVSLLNPLHTINSSTPRQKRVRAVGDYQKRHDRDQCPFGEDVRSVCVSFGQSLARKKRAGGKGRENANKTTQQVQLASCVP